MRIFIGIPIRLEPFYDWNMATETYRCDGRNPVTGEGLNVVCRLIGLKGWRQAPISVFESVKLPVPKGFHFKHQYYQQIQNHYNKEND